MAGLSLGVGAYGNSGTGGMMPVAAGVSPGAPNISSLAFGTYSQQSGATGPRTAAYGTVTLGLAGALVLLFLWHSLPR